MRGSNTTGLAAVTVVLAVALTATGCGVETEGSASDTVDSSEGALAAPTCAPALAKGAVAKNPRALLETIAFAEGTAGSCGQDGYNTGFAYNCFRSCAEHPDKVWRSSGYASSAAGRYQFLSATWRGLGYASFSPGNQDRGAIALVVRRGVSLPDRRALTATEFSNAMKKISYEWASLPYSPYGQPRKSLSAVRAKYCSFADCRKTCASATLGRDVPHTTCVEARSDRAWYRCDDGEWVDSTSSDRACTARYPL